MIDLETHSTRVLLTSVCRPFGGPGEGDSVGAELFHAQVTRAQGPFSPRQTIRVWGLDYIAENIQAPTVSLHYPSLDELIRELGREEWTHVGISFVVATFHKVREMVPLIRRYAPKAQIVLGGYGTVLPDALLQPFSDAICREEGVSFMRRLLGEPIDAPIQHPHAPVPATSVLSYPLGSVVGHVTAGLGCSNGCDFCCTSHFFRRKYLPFARTGRDLYEALLATRARAQADGETMSSFVIIDEDFFLHQRRARQFLDCVREGGEALSLLGFGSVRGLSQYTAREIAEMGFDLVWNAFEGKAAGYDKQRGRPLPELYADLKSVGCAQLTSMIIGFPYQDEAKIREEFAELRALEPAMTQCLIYFAFPGTPFHTQVVAENRYLERYRAEPDLRRWDGFAMHFKHPHFSRPERVEELQREIYAEDYRRMGPSLLRLARVWLRGYETLRNDPSPLLRLRAERLKASARFSLPLIGAAIAFAPSSEARERARALRRDLVRLTGELSATERVLEAGTAAMYLVTQGLRGVGLMNQPGLLRVEHRTGNGDATRHTRQVQRLQGARRGSFSALVDEARERVREIFQRDDPGSPKAAHPLPLDVVTTKSAPLPRSLPLLDAI